eukprot:6391526-Prymnesium_polylepis.1
MWSDRRAARSAPPPPMSSRARHTRAELTCCHPGNSSWPNTSAAAVGRKSAAVSEPGRRSPASRSSADAARASR